MFRMLFSIKNFDHLPVEEADDRIKTSFRDYVKQKGYSKGITSLALLTANANQLHFVLTHPDAHLRTLETVFLCLSITLQVNMTYSTLYVCIRLPKDRRLKCGTYFFIYEIVSRE